MRTLLAVAFLAATSQVHARTLEEIVSDLKVANERQEAELENAKSRIAWTWDELGKAQTQIDQVGKERDGWRSYGESEHDKWMNAEKRVAGQKAAILRRDIAVGLLTLAIGAWAFLKFYLHIPI